MTTVVDYQPTFDGQAVDPALAGGAVRELRLYATPERAGTPLVVAGPATRVAAGLYRFVIEEPVPARRYFMVVEWVPDAGHLGLAYIDGVDTLDLPIRADLVVSVEDVLWEMGLEDAADARLRETAARAIRSAQAMVAGDLGRPIIPEPRSAAGCWPHPEGWGVRDADGYEVTVTGATPEQDAAGALTGRFTVHYLAGLDARNDPALAPIREYVLAHATNTPALVRAWTTLLNPRGPVTNVAAEGQSMSWAPATLGGGGAAGSGAPGALPTLATLSRWKRRSVYQRRQNPVLDPFWS